jgi:RHH-type proline utilization regulon transcriptional repressor/proline dehydrogenase/delta 1-pyrroline-5-carboxylate dehydrogenase
MVITASADLDLAVKDLVRSAFGHSGQKCSAASLALVEAGVCDSQEFRERLRDAAASLAVGPAWDPASVVTPLVQDPGPDLLRGLTQLDPGESWLLEPRRTSQAPNHWSPGVRLGVRPGSWFHRTECFGPVLGVVRVRDLDEAIAVQNTSRFGLTGGIHSLDPGEIERWRGAVEVGNAYVNRGTTGAVVRRQPFGGWKASVVGGGAKAGGPNYVASFLRWRTDGLPKAAAPVSAEVAQVLESLRPRGGDKGAFGTLSAAAASDAYHWQTHFSQAHDPSRLHGESNEFRYLPRKRVVLYLPAPDPFAAARVRLACAAAGVPLEACGRDAGHGATFNPGDTLRAPLGCPEALRRDASRAGVPVLDAPVVLNGRVELLHYLREQAVTETTHRYGNPVPWRCRTENPNRLYRSATRVSSCPAPALMERAAEL